MKQMQKKLQTLYIQVVLKLYMARDSVVSLVCRIVTD